MADLEQIPQPLHVLGVNYHNSDKVAFEVWWVGQGAKAPSQCLGLEPECNDRRIDPDGTRREVLRVIQNHANPMIHLTDNGCAMREGPDARGYAADRDRIRHWSEHIQSIQRGADVCAFYAWSIPSNLGREPGDGHRFGSVRVEYAALRRIPRKSACWYGDVVHRKWRGDLSVVAPQDGFFGTVVRRPNA